MIKIFIICLDFFFQFFYSRPISSINSYLSILQVGLCCPGKGWVHYMRGFFGCSVAPSGSLEPRWVYKCAPADAPTHPPSTQPQATSTTYPLTHWPGAKTPTAADISLANSNPQGVKSPSFACHPDLRAPHFFSFINCNVIGSIPSLSFLDQIFQT